LQIETYALDLALRACAT
jgi:hypothetical protein